MKYRDMLSYVVLWGKFVGLGYLNTNWLDSDEGFMLEHEQSCQSSINKMIYEMIHIAIKYDQDARFALIYLQLTA